MSILIIGSIAIDNISYYKGNLKNALEKESINGKVNMSIRTNSFFTGNGGTGLNSSYNLALLGEKPVLLGAVGEDFYFDNFIKENISLKYIYKSQLLKTSNSSITKDSFGNQLSVFFPGAMEKADHLKIEAISETLNYALISSTKKEAMFFYLNELSALGTKIFFDPGQQLSIMNRIEIDSIIQKAHYLIVNEHEFILLQKISGLTAEEIINSFEKTIITFGKNGSQILDKNSKIEIPPIENDDITDDTGAGEAYRAGLIKGIIEGYSWETAGKMGTLLASFSLGSKGAQNHFINKKQFEMWFADEYKEFIKL